MNQIRTEIRQSCSSLPRDILRFFLVSLYPNESILYKFFSYVYVALLIAYPINNTFLILQHADDFDFMVQTLFHAAGGVIAIFKFITIVVYRRHMNNVINKLVDLQKKTNTEKWSQDFVYNINLLVIIYCVFTVSAIIILGLATLIGRIIIDDPAKWSLPFSDVSFMDRSYSPNYEIAWLYQTASVFFLAPQFCLTDFLLVGLIADVVVQVKLIQQRMRTTIQEGMELSKLQENPNASWFYLNNALRTIVIDHISLFDLALDIERVSNKLLLFNVFGHLGMTCFSVYYALVLTSLFSFTAFQVLMQLICITTCVFITSYWGTQLLLSSQGVGTACYECNFWETDVRFQKAIRFIIMRSQKPMTVTVGKFTILSITVFVWIIKNSYTFFMVLRKSNERMITVEEESTK